VSGTARDEPDAVTIDPANDIVDQRSSFGERYRHGNLAFGIEDTQFAKGRCLVSPGLPGKLARKTADKIVQRAAR